MSLSTNNYANSGQRKEHKIIKNRLQKHFELMKIYESEGLIREEASRKAYLELFNK